MKLGHTLRMMEKSVERKVFVSERHERTGN
jgi:hypothetical protein